MQRTDVASWRLEDGSQAALWWIALAAMVVDHVGALFLPGVLELRLVGRVVYPVLAFLVAYNVVLRGVPPEKYLARLLPFAILAQVPYGVAFDPWTGNILFTLALGVASMRGGPWALAVLIPFAVPVDYGFAGVVLLPLVGLFLQARHLERIGWLVAVVACVFALNPGITLGAFGLAGLGLVMFSHLLPSMPRGPKYFGYFFYPGHLLLLVAVSGLISKV